MSNVYLSSSGYSQPTQNTYSNIGYGGSNLNLPLTINSTAGIIFCNNGGTQLGNSCSISSNGVFNCMGLVLGGPLTCASLIVPSSGSITCLGSFNCSGVLNMNTNNISGVANLTCTSLTCNSIMSIGVINVTAAGVITGVTSLTCNGPIGPITSLTCNTLSCNTNVVVDTTIFRNDGYITGVNSLNGMTISGAIITGVTMLNGMTIGGNTLTSVTKLNGMTLNGSNISGVTNLNGMYINGNSNMNLTSLNGMSLNLSTFTGTKLAGTTLSCVSMNINSTFLSQQVSKINATNINVTFTNNQNSIYIGPIPGSTSYTPVEISINSTSIFSGNYIYANTTTLFSITSLNKTLSIYADGSIISGRAIVCSASITYSDNRIKTNIIDIDDVSAMATLRLIEPKRYNYIDVINRGSEPVWGFIAQQVRSVLPYSTSLMKKEIPNVYDIGSVASDMITITLSSKSTSLFQRDVSGNLFSICLMDNDNIEIKTTITAIIDDKTFTIADNLTDKQIGTLSKIFVYGSIVDDFHILDKAAIFTIAAAALQELDREFYETKSEMTKLTLQNASICVEMAELTSQNALMSSQIATLIAQVNLLMRRKT